MDLYRANGAEDLGRKLLLTPTGKPRKPPKTDCGYCDSISQNAYPASPLEFSPWADKKLLGDLQQSVPQNSRVPLTQCRMDKRSLDSLSWPSRSECPPSSDSNPRNCNHKLLAIGAQVLRFRPPHTYRSAQEPRLESAPN